MREIHGVGDTKLERYGAAFLEVVQAHPPARSPARNRPPEATL